METSGIDASENILVQARSTLEKLGLQADEIKQRLAEASDVTAQATAQAEEIFEAVKTAATELSDIKAQSEVARTGASEVLATKTQVEDMQVVIAAKSDHIEQAQVHADKVRSNLDRIHTQVTQKLNEVEAAADLAENHIESVGEHQLAAKAARASIEADRQTADEELEKITGLLTELKRFSANAEKAEQKALAYEKKLEEHQKQIQDRITTIDSLLPGATSAGLATAFDERRKSFLEPGKQWQWVFVGSLVVLVLIALTGLWHVFFAATPLSYDELFRLWLARLPIAGALVWLAIYASRESSLAKRLEEDYGYKAAIAASFQGFHKQMADIVEQAGVDTPVAKLCADTLTTIGSPPGRIYDKHNLTISPSSEVAEMLRTLLGKVRASEAKNATDKI